MSAVRGAAAEPAILPSVRKKTDTYGKERIKKKARSGGILKKGHQKNKHGGERKAITRREEKRWRKSGQQSKRGKTGVGGEDSSRGGKDVTRKGPKAAGDT